MVYLFLSHTQVGGVSCEMHGDLCQKHGVQSYPSFKLVVEGKTIDYQRGAETKALFDFISENVPTKIANVRRPQQATELLESAAKGGKKPAVLLFTDKYDTSLLYKALAFQLRDSALFGEVRASNAMVADRFGVGKYPTLLVFCEGSEDAIVEYKGEMKAKEMREFVMELAISKKCWDASKKTKRSPPREKPILDPGTDFKKMKVSQLKAMLEEQGEQCVGCAEKEDFVRKLEDIAKTQAKTA